MLAAAEAHGRASRVLYAPRDGSKARRIAAVADAREAVRLWSAVGVRGRRLVVLTGRWSRPSPGELLPPAAGASGDAAPGASSADGALYAAVRLGLVRSLDVVMPPAAFSHRLGEVRAAKGLVRADGAFGLPYHGVERRFCAPRALRAPDEPALVLVEPSWFEDGAPPDPLAWLASAGVVADLALVALDDPAASTGERAAALGLARAYGVPWVEADE